MLGAFIFQFGLLILGVSQLFAAAMRAGEWENGLTAFPSASHMCQLSHLASFYLSPSVTFSINNCWIKLSGVSEGCFVMGVPSAK